MLSWCNNWLYRHASMFDVVLKSYWPSQRPEAQPRGVQAGRLLLKSRRREGDYSVQPLLLKGEAETGRRPDISVVVCAMPLYRGEFAKRKLLPSELPLSYLRLSLCALVLGDRRPTGLDPLLKIVQRPPAAVAEQVLVAQECKHGRNCGVRAIPSSALGRDKLADEPLVARFERGTKTSSPEAWQLQARVRSNPPLFAYGCRRRLEPLDRDGDASPRTRRHAVLGSADATRTRGEPHSTLFQHLSCAS